MKAGDRVRILTSMPDINGINAGSLGTVTYVSAVDCLVTVDRYDGDPNSPFRHNWAFDKKELEVIEEAK